MMMITTIIITIITKNTTITVKLINIFASDNLCAPDDPDADLI